MSKIRENSAVLMGLLLFFFLASMTVGGLVGGANIMDKILGRNQERMFVGKVEGYEITHTEFRNEQNRQLSSQRQAGASIDSRAVHNAQNTAWNTIIDRVIQEDKVEEMGLEATDDEIYEFLLYTPPASLQGQLTESGLFADSTGTFILEDYQQALRTGDFPPQMESFWVVWENYLRDWLPYRKLQNIYNSTGAVSEFEIKREYEKKNITCTLEYIFVSTNNIPDSLMEVPDSDLLAKYNDEKRDKYLTPETRTVDYVFWSNDLSAIDSTRHSSYLDSINSAALRFSSEADYAGFIEAAAEFSMMPEDTLEISEGYDANSGIPFQMGVLRNAVRFAWDSEIGSISDPINTDNGIAVFRILGEKKSASKPFEEVQESIRRGLIRDIKKDYARNLILEALDSGEAFAAIAEQNDFIEFASDTSKTLGSSFQKIGRSNELTGTLRAMSAGDMAGPVETFSSVVALKMIEKDAFNEEQYAEEHDNIRDQLLRTRQNGIFNSWLTEYKATLDIVDFRSKVY